MKPELKQSIFNALRKEFDHPATHTIRLKEIKETVKQLGWEDEWREMDEDMIGEGYITRGDDFNVINNEVFKN